MLEIAPATPPSPGPLATSQSQGCLNPGLLIVILVWSAGLAFIRPTVLLVASASLGQAFSPTGLFTGLIQAGLLLLTLTPLALFWRDRRYRSFFATLALAAGLSALLIPVELLNAKYNQLQSALHIIISGFYLLVLLLISRRSPVAAGPNLEVGSHKRRPALAASAASLALAALGAIPWLAYGAFGSPIDTVLALLAGLLLGTVAALIIHRYLLAALLTGGASPARSVLLGGFVASAIIGILLSGLGYSFGGVQLCLLIGLASWGPAVLGLGLLAGSERGETPLAASVHRAWLPTALMLGLLVAAPLALIDPDELALVFSASPGETLSYGFQAALWTFLIGGVASLILAGVSAGLKPAQATPRQAWALPITTLLALVTLAGASALYLTRGQPGFYGEKMFVILADQADLSGAEAISDPLERRSFVYRTLTEYANTSQAALRQALTQRNVSYRSFYLVNAIEVANNPALRLWLEGRSEVDRVLDSPRMRPLPELPGSAAMLLAETSPGELWNLEMIGANRVWSELGVTGEGIVIGQSDSGAQFDHPELAVSYRGRDGNHEYNWFDPWYGSPEPVDLGGHGTHTLASIVGNHTGVAPGATWYGCANLVRNQGAPGLYLECMQYMLAPFPSGSDPLLDGDPTLGANVLNNSWGCPDIEGCDPEALLPAVQALRAAGVFVVVSAGNDGPSCSSINSPLALYDEVYSVGGVDRSGELASFSSLGPVTIDGSRRVKPDILAPGVSVYSAMPGDSYAALSGTSMAGPHVVGVVALMWSANPALIGDIERTEQILNETAQPYQGSLPACAGAGEIPSTAAGYGIVDAYAAVQRALQIGR